MVVPCPNQPFPGLGQCNLERQHIRFEGPTGLIPHTDHVQFFFDRFHIVLTIRQAQWAARLYAAVTDTENLAWHVRTLANIDKYLEDAGITDFMGGQWDNLSLYSTMMGHEITRDEDWRCLQMLGITDEVFQQMKEVMNKVDRESTRPDEHIDLWPLRRGPGHWWRYPVGRGLRAIHGC